MSSDSLFSGNYLLKHAYKRVDELASALLHHSVSIVFWLEEKSFKAVWWDGYDAESFRLSTETNYLDEFRLGFSRVLPIVDHDTVEQELKTLLGQLDMAVGLLAPLFIKWQTKRAVVACLGVCL